jgi:hypothetical protein
MRRDRRGDRARSTDHINLQSNRVRQLALLLAVGQRHLLFDYGSFDGLWLRHRFRSRNLKSLIRPLVIGHRADA